MRLILRGLPEHESVSAAINCTFSERINIGAKIVDTARGRPSIRGRSCRTPHRISRRACRFSVVRSAAARRESTVAGPAAIRRIVVSAGRNCVLAAQMRYALSTFIRMPDRPSPVPPRIADGDHRLRTGGVSCPCSDLHDMVIFLDTRQQCHTRAST